jgi:MFS family permease
MFSFFRAGLACWCRLALPAGCTWHPPLPRDRFSRHIGGIPRVTGLGGLQWVADAYTIPLAATVLTAGAIADRLGRRRLFLLGLAVFTASSALCGAAGDIGVLVGARAIQGLGASIMFATALALISQVTPTRASRTNALAAYGAAIGASLALGPFIRGSLTDLLGSHRS